ncbi:MAG TPA: hypothetical protein VF930_09335 [Stellaceae bacterium]
MQASICSRSDGVMPNIAKMRPKALDDAEIAVRDQLLFGLAVFRRKEHVVREGHDQGFRLAAAERGLEIAIRVPADVAVPPLPPIQIRLFAGEPCDYHSSSEGEQNALPGLALRTSASGRVRGVRERRNGRQPGEMKGGPLEVTVISARRACLRGNGSVLAKVWPLAARDGAGPDRVLPAVSRRAVTWADIWRRISAATGTLGEPPTAARH